MKKVYLVIETYTGNGYTDGLDYEIEKLEYISVFSSLKGAKEYLNKIYEKEKDWDTSIINDEGTHFITYYDFFRLDLDGVEYPENYIQLSDLILKERQNGNFPEYRETYILTKELKGDN